MRVDVGTIGVDTQVVGTGPEPVLFVHGLGANRTCWRRAYEYLDQDRYTLVLPDLPGFGASDKGEEYSYQLPDLAAALHGVLEHLRIGAAHVVAHSMGGAVALLLAGRPGLRIKSILLAEGNLAAGDAFMSSKVARMKESIFLRVYSKWIKTVRDSLGPELMPIHEEFIESLWQAAPYAVHRASVSCAEVSASGELSERFAGLDCPRGYIVGGQTEREIPGVIREVTTEIMTVPDRGHFMMGDAERFYALVRDFLARANGE
jgi:pimeloyl-ACP methyl ester carboxylesterase